VLPITDRMFDYSYPRLHIIPEWVTYDELRNFLMREDGTSI
jgi:hypothetical protein